MATERQRRGAASEAAAADYLSGRGWRIVARNLRLGRDEIDLLAIEPGPAPALVLVEVRGLRSTLFGAPEERVDAAKVGHLYRAMAALGRSGELRRLEVSQLPRRVDLVIVDGRIRPPQIRHLRALEPP